MKMSSQIQQQQYYGDDEEESLQNAYDAYDTVDSVHAMRIKEFLIMNNQQQVVQRPKCSISPINSDMSSSSSISCDASTKNTTDELPTSTNFLMPSSLFQMSTNSPAFHQNYIRSPRCLIPAASSAFQSPASSIPIQSTPNKYLTQKSNKSINNKVNFHSISDLARSSTSASSASLSNSSQSSINFNNSTAYHTDTSIIDHADHSSICHPQSQFQNISQISSNNKENNYSLSHPPIDYFSNNFIYRENKRKPRTQITRQHREVLERVYAANKYPDSNEIEYLTHLLGFDENVIRIWFQNKRARDKLRR